ncbi:MAG: hypothetical protein ABIQ16_02005 [Polyangiaceae bacterium]
MNKRTVAGTLLALLGTFGCQPDFDPGSRVTSFRVLGQQLDEPFAKPGEKVTVTSLSYDPEGRPVTWAWAACVNPASASVTGCIDKLAEQTSENGPSPILARGVDMSSFTYTIPTDALDTISENARSGALVGLLSVACPGDLSVTPGHSGFPFQCLEAGTQRELALDEYVVGLKRVQVRTTDRNLNPTIERVTFDGEEWPEDEVKIVAACDTDGNDYKNCNDASKHQLSAVPTADSVESGRTQFGAAFREQVIVEYYATEGIFEYEIKIAAEPETNWAARKAASGKDLTLWMVVHDDRGGATWAQRQVHVQ